MTIATARPATSSFIARRAALDAGIADRLELRRQVRPVERTRTITKRDLVRNAALPVIEVDPETFAVRADGVHATVPPSESVSLNRLMFFS